jgi:hypothetical protein
MAVQPLRLHQNHDECLCTVSVGNPASIPLSCEVLNLLNHNNVRYAGFDGYYSDGRVIGQMDRVLPILPSAGISSSSESRQIACQQGVQVTILTAIETKPHSCTASTCQRLAKISKVPFSDGLIGLTAAGKRRSNPAEGMRQLVDGRMTGTNPQTLPKRRKTLCERRISC